MCWEIKMRETNMQILIKKMVANWLALFFQLTDFTDFVGPIKITEHEDKSRAKWNLVYSLSFSFHRGRAPLFFAHVHFALNYYSKSNQSHVARQHIYSTQMMTSMLQ